MLERIVCVVSTVVATTLDVISAVVLTDSMECRAVHCVAFVFTCYILILVHCTLICNRAVQFVVLNGESAAFPAI